MRDYLIDTSLSILVTKFLSYFVDSWWFVVAQVAYFWEKTVDFAVLPP